MNNYEFLQDYNLQARIYYNRGHIDYAYQLFTNAPVLRWDNKEEFKSLENYPHHFHNFAGDIVSSPLIGDPYKDIQLVLQEVDKFISST